MIRMAIRVGFLIAAVAFVVGGASAEEPMSIAIALLGAAVCLIEAWNDR